MFMRSGQLFSQGERASSWQTPARQRWATMWSSYSSRKWRMVVSTGLGADWPSAQSEHSRIIRPNSSSRPRCSALPLPSVIELRMRSALFSPTLHGTHLPQDSEWVNSMK